MAIIAPTPASPTENNNRIATTAWVNSFVNAGLPLASGKIYIGSAGNVATAQTMSGDATLAIGGALTLATVNANVGSFGSATNCVSITTNAKGLITAASAATCTPAVASVTGLGTGIAAWLGTPSSANLRTALTDETGTGVAVFGTSPTLTTPNIVGSVAGDNAAAGSVGEFITATVVQGSAVALTSGAVANITSIVLTAGDWDIGGGVFFNPASTTSVTRYGGSLETTNSAFSSSPTQSWITTQSAFVPGTNNTIGFPVPTWRQSVSGTTTYYLNCVAVFTTSTLGGYGTIWARRRR
ncbi:hypothetical protein JOE50_003513 [Bradyrhizobium japonicum]|nr:hypothetical protein [Bradyrhizobium japonicum]